MSPLGQDDVGQQHPVPWARVGPHPPRPPVPAGHEQRVRVHVGHPRARIGRADRQRVLVDHQHMHARVPAAQRNGKGLPPELAPLDSCIWLLPSQPPPRPCHPSHPTSLSLAPASPQCRRLRQVPERRLCRHPAPDECAGVERPPPVVLARVHQMVIAPGPSHVHTPAETVPGDDRRQELLGGCRKRSQCWSHQALYAVNSAITCDMPQGALGSLLLL